jgi:hypothetical protein
VSSGPPVIGGPATFPSIPLPAGGSAAGTLRVYRSANAPGGVPSWSAVPRSISVQIDTAGTLPAGLTTLAEMRLQRDTSANRDLRDLLVTLLPGEYLYVTAQTTGAAQAWEVSLNGKEAV